MGTVRPTSYHYHTITHSADLSVRFTKGQNNVAES
jgi:hypothetical protein